VSVVVDPSVVVAALTGKGSAGDWAESLLLDGALSAPALLPVEAANVLRRAVLADELPEALAEEAHADLLDLRIDLFPYAPFGPRVWELRANLTAYDAWYVAVAEGLEVPLATLDLRLARAPGPRCRFLTPPAGRSSRPRR
jgi:predicted nucleic acid-binding protein